MKLTASMKKKTKAIKTSREYILISFLCLFSFGCGYIFASAVPNLQHNSHVDISYPVASNQQERHNQTFPACATSINRSGYSLYYDHRTKNALWVYEKITADGLRGDTNRGHLPFKEDPAIEKIFRSTLQDYRGSGFDRGHLAPAANHKCNAEEMADTFFLSNMSPQDPLFNRGYWAKLEKYVRDLTKKNRAVEVFSGPLFLPKEGDDGKKWVTYRVIGENNVAVPTHYYKILVLESAIGEKNTEAYILPNEEISSNEPLNSFKTSVKKVESLAGIKFFQTSK